MHTLRGVGPLIAAKEMVRRVGLLNCVSRVQHVGRNVINLCGGPVRCSIRSCELDDVSHKMNKNYECCCQLGSVQALHVEKQPYNKTHRRVQLLHTYKAMRNVVLHPSKGYLFLNK